MFFWCFKRRPADKEEYQRPKTRISSANSTKTTLQTLSNDSNETHKSLEQMQRECLESHNKYRAKHGASPLTLSNQLNALAMEWAKHLADSNSMQHRKNNKYGENLYLGSGMGSQSHDLAVQAWYDEIKNYDFNKPEFSSNTGHFTQVVWKTTKQLGVGIVAKDNRTWVVCNYDPPGNIMGTYMNCVAPLVQETAAKIIDKMKSQNKNMPEKTAYSASDLKLWSKYELECLDSHNKYRALHGSPAMKLNRKLCNLAQEWSKHLAKKSCLSHRPQNEYGENIYYCMNMDPSAEHCVKSWYDEIKNYNFSKPGFSSQTGHFTQVVWRDSLELGVGITQLNNMTFVVCNYFHAGNVMNQYKDQVPRAGAKPIVSPAAGTSTKPANKQQQQQPTFEKVCLDEHNTFRALHGTPAMSLNNNLSFFANDWAQVGRTTNTSYAIKTTRVTTTTKTIN